MKFATLALLGVASAHDEVENAYLQYVAEYGKSYGTEEEYKFRLAIYRQKIDFIREHNAAAKEGEAVVGVNHMMDWTDGEYKKLLGYRSRPLSNKGETFTGAGVTAPAAVDWRTKGAVTPIKNQGSCGSCWAFSTTGSMEGRYEIAGNTLTSFSEQQFVDCSTAQGNQGCNGGLMDDAFEYAETVKIETEAQYAYTGRDGTCHASGGVTEVKSFKDVTTKDPKALEAAVAEGPVSVAIDAAGLAMQLYFGGVIKHFCGTSLDHGVLVVGYGTEAGYLYGTTDYWILKNSWGAGWGEKGFFRIAKDTTTNGAGVCGLQLQPSYPIF
jgi:C1A family cysteine protease